MTNGTALETTVDKPLTAHETQAFERLCQVVDNGFRVWVEVGEALITLREGKLYRAKYPGHTFEQFVQERWGKTRQWAYLQINAASLAQELGDTVRLPNERVARAFLESELKDDRKAMVFAATIAAFTAPGKLTEEWAKSTVDVVLDARNSSGLVDTGNGDWAAANAAITQEAWQRMIEHKHQVRTSHQKPVANFITSGESLKLITSNGDDKHIDDDENYRIVVYHVVTVEESK